MLIKEIAKFLKKIFIRFFFTKGFIFFEKFGIHVLPVHYYTPIPDTRLLCRQNILWSKELSLEGIKLNIEKTKPFLKTVCLPFQKEYLSFPKEKTNNSLQYYLNNGSFGFVSGQLHYSIIRYFKPKKIIEVGSGYSTLVTIEALRKNNEEGTPFEFFAIEPYPAKYLKDVVGVNIIKKKVEEIDVQFFQTLNENDLLFIDSSHTVKIGGDVNFLILEVLPKLRKGVIIHIHDIHFPYEYFKSYILKQHLFWQEQYLVQAFLMYNNSFKVLWCASYMHHKYPELLKKYFSPYPSTRIPTSLYIQKINH